LLAGGVFGFGLQPSLGLRFGIEEHPMPCAVDPSINEPSLLAPLVISLTFIVRNFGLPLAAENDVPPFAETVKQEWHRVPLLGC